MYQQFEGHPSHLFFESLLCDAYIVRQILLLNSYFIYSRKMKGVVLNTFFIASVYSVSSFGKECQNYFGSAVLSAVKK